MSQKSGRQKFVRLFIQIHVISIILAGLTSHRTDLLTGTVSYLFYIHITAGIAYLYTT
ncbi:MAG: hypothetical protein ABEJ87_02195 [Candidatus Nanohalobium sp.]